MNDHDLLIELKTEFKTRMQNIETILNNLTSDTTERLKYLEATAERLDKEKVSFVRFDQNNEQINKSLDRLEKGITSSNRWQWVTWAGITIIAFLIAYVVVPLIPLLRK